MKYKFGDEGIWHMPTSDHQKKRDVPAVVLEQLNGEGCLYLFTHEPIIRGHDNLSNRTVTIFSSDFTKK